MASRFAHCWSPLQSHSSTGMPLSWSNSRILRRGARTVGWRPARVKAGPCTRRTQPPRDAAWARCNCVRLLRGWRRDRAGEALDTDLQPAVGSYSGLGFSCLLCCPRKLLMVVFPLFLGPTTKILTLVGAALIPVRGERQWRGASHFPSLANVHGGRGAYRAPRRASVHLFDVMRCVVQYKDSKTFERARGGGYGLDREVGRSAAAAPPTDGTCPLEALLNAVFTPLGRSLPSERRRSTTPSSRRPFAVGWRSCLGKASGTTLRRACARGLFFASACGGGRRRATPR